MAMHVLAAAAVLQILPTAFPRRSK
jgi:hypothetical protein